MWDTPENFMFPNRTSRSKGWRLWLCGIPAQRIKPFRMMKATMLPKKARNKFKLEWRPIFDKMEKGVTTPIPSNPSSDVVDTTFAEGTHFLRTQLCAFIWESDKFKTRDEWSVGTWSNKTNFRQIKACGTVSDKTNLPRESHHNRKRRRLNAPVPTN